MSVQSCTPTFANKEFPHELTLKVFSFLRDPRIAAVSSVWREIVERHMYFDILLFYKTDALLYQYITVDIPGDIRAQRALVIAIYRSVMVEAGSFYSQRPTTALKSSPLDLVPVSRQMEKYKRREDENLVKIFTVLLAQIPDDFRPRIHDGLNIDEKAWFIRDWMHTNQAILDRVIALRLSDCDLTTIPSEMQKLRGLQRLNLSGNKLTGLPDFFGNLNLRTLYLSRNPIKTLPDSFKRLTHLEKLFIAHAELDKVPACIAHLTRLKSLCLIGNRIRHLPWSLFNLKELVSLALANNLLEEFPVILLRLPRLKEVNIAANQPGLLPENVCKQFPGIEIHRDQEPVLFTKQPLAWIGQAVLGEV